MLSIDTKTLEIIHGKKRYDPQSLVDTKLKKRVSEIQFLAPEQSAANAGAFFTVGEPGSMRGNSIIGKGMEVSMYPIQGPRVKQYVFFQSGAGFSITDEDLDDIRKSGGNEQLLFTIQRGIEYLVDSASEFKERLAAAVWLNGDDANYEYSDVNLVDGQPTFSASHTWSGLPGTQSNKADAYLVPTKDTIRQIVRAIRHFTNPQGGIVSTSGALTLLCSSILIDDNALDELFTSQGDITNAANRDVNPIRRNGRYGQWAGSALREILHFEDSLSWFITRSGSDGTPFRTAIRTPRSTKHELVETRGVNTHYVWSKERIAVVPNGNWTDAYAVMYTS